MEMIGKEREREREREQNSTNPEINQLHQEIQNLESKPQNNLQWQADLDEKKRRLGELEKQSIVGLQTKPNNS